MKKNNKENLENNDFVELQKEDFYKEIVDKVYKFVLLDNTSKNIILLKATIIKENIESEKKEEKDNKYSIKIESNLFDKNKLDKSLNLTDGLIFTYSMEEQDSFKNILDYIKKFEKNFIKGRFFPKIILGDKDEFQNSINKLKNHSKYYIKNIYFLNNEASTNINIAVDALIKMKKLNDNYEKYLNQNKINVKNILNIISKNKTNLMKCLNCNKIVDISFDELSKTILLSCNKCKYEEMYDILNYDKFKKEVICVECEKEINESIVNHCFNCKENICNECIKKHLQKDNNLNSEKHNLTDIICLIHEKFCYKYCVECKKSICIECEIEYHMNHKYLIYNEKEVCDLLNTQKINLKKEKENYIKIQSQIEDCFESLRRYINN